jgi:hypothetical protein
MAQQDPENLTGDPGELEHSLQGKPELPAALGRDPDGLGAPVEVQANKVDLLGNRDTMRREAGLVKKSVDLLGLCSDLVPRVPEKQDIVHVNRVAKLTWADRLVRLSIPDT